MKSLIEQLKEKILPVLRRYDVARAAFFGSVATGDFKQDSDIDLLIEFKGEKSLLDLSALKIALEELLEKKVDVLTYNSLHPLLKNRILSEQKVIL